MMYVVKSFYRYELGHLAPSNTTDDNNVTPAQSAWMLNDHGLTMEPKTEFQMQSDAVHVLLDAHNDYCLILL